MVGLWHGVDMADLSITSANVIAASGANIAHRTAGATITAGQAVYIAAATGLVMLADADSATAEARVPVGIALNGAANGQPIAIALPGSDVTIGATMTANVVYYLSDEPGGICPVADLASGDYTCTIGMAISTTVLRIDITAAPGAL
jgi:hypothetical protein